MNDDGKIVFMTRAEYEAIDLSKLFTGESLEQVLGFSGPREVIVNEKD